MSWIDDLVAWGASFGKSTTVIVPVGSGTLTVGDVRAAMSGLPALGIALSDIVHGTATLADAEVITVDALKVASLADPALAPVLGVATQLLPLVISLLESGVIEGDPEPFIDAQLTGTHSAR